MFKMGHSSHIINLMDIKRLWIVILVLCSGGVTCSQVDSERELWLEDYTRVKSSDGNIQADSPHDIEELELFTTECPPLSDSGASVLDCIVSKCETDLDCQWPKQKCCHNGCLKTCLDAIPPPPFVDWRREPQRDPITGISWLIKDEDDSDVVVSADHCVVDNLTYKDGEQFKHYKHTCNCHKGLVDCTP